MLIDVEPTLVVVAGDVNSTLACALAAAKLGIPIAHVESGLRSFDWTMPEEINRVVTDRLSDLLFAHSPEAIENLVGEGIEASRIHFVGNTMIDSLRRCERRARARGVAASMGLDAGSYLLVTLHRPSNVDYPLRLAGIVGALVELAERSPVVFPIHPRTRARLIEDGSLDRLQAAGVHCIDPVGYLDFLSLQADAGAVVTDSGGVQEETSALGIPCFTFRTYDGAPDHDHPRHQHAAGRRPRRSRERADPGVGADAVRDPALGRARRRAARRHPRDELRALRGARHRQRAVSTSTLISPRVDVLDCPVDALDMDATVARCSELIEAGGFHQHVAINAAKLVAMHDDPQLRDIVVGCDVISADGQSVVWASRLLGAPLPERVAGVDLMDRLLAEAELRGYGVFILGARADVLDEAVRRIRERHPQITIAGARDGYFSDAEEAEVCEEIRSSGAHILFVAISSPRKELFLGEHGPSLEVPFVMGVGGSIDVMAGITKRAPRLWQRLGIEWLYRLLQEPRRMFRRYAVTNVRFLLLLGRAVAARRTAS